MYSAINEYFTTMEFTTINKPLWRQIFSKEEHHATRKEAGVTYGNYSYNRKNENALSIVFKYDKEEQMRGHSDKIQKLMEENREKWSALGDLDSIQFNHWKILCERTNDLRFDSIMNNTDDVMWSARHKVGDKNTWVAAMKASQDAGANYDIRWWALMENTSNPDEVYCAFRMPRDRLTEFLLNFVETLPVLSSGATVDLGSCEVKFWNIEWEHMYNMPISFQKPDDETVLRSMIEDMANNIGSNSRGRQHMRDDCLFIRPSGNPLDMKGWDDMMNSPDVTMTGSSLISINKLEIVGSVAYACYTTHSQFTYKGTENDDIAVLTGVFRKIDGIWKLIHGQRSSGRKPADPLPQF